MRHRILAVILDFVEETEERKKNQPNSPGPVCILQIFGNNPSRGFRVRAGTKSVGGRTEQKQLVSTTT